MEIHPYLAQAIFSAISGLLVFCILGLTTRTVITGSHTRMILSLFVSIAITVVLTTYFNGYIQDFFTQTLSFKNYTLWKTIVEGILVAIIFGLFMRNYFADRKYLMIGLITLASYIIVLYWVTPLLYRFYDFIMYMIERFL